MLHSVLFSVWYCMKTIADSSNCKNCSALFSFSESRNNGKFYTEYSWQGIELERRVVVGSIHLHLEHTYDPTTLIVSKKYI